MTTTTSSSPTLGARLRQLRAATGCTRAEIAAAAGMSVDDLEWIESTPRFHVSERAVMALALVYGVTLGELVGGEVEG